MNYAIYKTDDGKHERVIHRFTQESCKHQAKRAAMLKLQQMWMRIASHPDIFRNATGSETEFSYDHYTLPEKSDRIRFFIAKL
jgi:hypothetical protein